MTILDIIVEPNEILTKQSLPVREFDDRLANLLDDMYETMKYYDGVGIAAVQIGILERIAIVDIGDDTGKLELINPEIITKRGFQIDEEGCLSIPRTFGEVKRPYFIKVKARNRHGKAYIINAEGFLARAIGHEIDHLNGVLFTSKAINFYHDGDREVE